MEAEAPCTCPCPPLPPPLLLSPLALYHSLPLVAFPALSFALISTLLGHCNLPSIRLCPYFHPYLCALSLSFLALCNLRALDSALVSTLILVPFIIFCLLYPYITRLPLSPPLFFPFFLAICNLLWPFLCPYVYPYPCAL